MVFAEHSDPYIQAALWSSVITGALTLFILLQLVWMRFVFLHREKRKQQFQTLWTPLLIRQLAGEQVEFPTLRNYQLADFLLLWVHYHESLRGEPKDVLNLMLHQLGIVEKIRQMLLHGNTRKQMLAAAALGHLRDESVWDVLAEIAKKPAPTLSITAARSLIMIDPIKAAAAVLPLLFERRDWPIPRLAIMLKEADEEFISRFLVKISGAAVLERPYMLRMLKLIEALHLNETLPFVHVLLANSKDAELVSSCLRLTQSPNDLNDIRARANSEDWSVRVQAATALGRLGTQADIPYLRQLLSDREWWVRYRAAQALVTLPSVSDQMLANMQSDLDDPFARDMLGQAIAEKRLA